MLLRRRAKHAAPPVGVESRAVVGTLAGTLVVVGGAMWLTTSVDLRIAGSLAIILGLLMFSSLLWGFPFRSLHVRTDAMKERRAALGGLLRVAATRLEHIAAVDPAGQKQRTLDQCVELSDNTHYLIDKALGPERAQEYAQVRDGVRLTGIPGVQADVAAKAAHVRGLIADLDNLTIMEDWQPGPSL